MTLYLAVNYTVLSRLRYPTANHVIILSLYGNSHVIKWPVVTLLSKEVLPETCAVHLREY